MSRATSGCRAATRSPLSHDCSVTLLQPPAKAGRIQEEQRLALTHWLLRRNRCQKISVIAHQRRHARRDGQIQEHLILRVPHHRTTGGKGLLPGLAPGQQVSEELLDRQRVQAEFRVSLHTHAIEDAGQDHASIAERFGAAVADIVVACTDTDGPISLGAEKEPWIVRKTRTIESLPHMPEAALLVIAADKAHNVRDLMLDSSRDPESWTRFKQGVRGACWYLSSLHSQLQLKLPHSRSVRQLGENVEAILAGEPFRRVWSQGGALRSGWRSISRKRGPTAHAMRAEKVHQAPFELSSLHRPGLGC